MIRKWLSKNINLTFLGYRTMVVMSKNYVDKIKELSRSNVYMKNRTRVNEILNELVTGGTNKLQVILDFDRTITKQHVNGTKQMSSFGIFEQCPSLPQSYVSKVTLLSEKYMPIEFNPSICHDEKKKHMEEWWRLSEKTVIGLTVTLAEIDDIVNKIKPTLRDETVELFDSAAKKDVPVLVFSAGLGQIVSAVLKYHKIFNENVKIVANFLKYENGIIQGFSDKTIINVFNKNEAVLAGTDYYHNIEDRVNAIVVGDSLGDATMFDGFPNGNAVLKIGFLYEHMEENLATYMDAFDIVLVDDQTMNIPYAILKCIL